MANVKENGYLVEDDKTMRYHVAVRKYWFRQKPIFTNRLSEYERKLRSEKEVRLVFNAGNMIYLMMRRLTAVDWEKQNALIYSYRNLMYKMSYVDIFWRREDMQVLHMKGQKNDIMWALSFISQVFPDLPLDVQTIPENEYTMSIRFQIQNGNYAGPNALQSARTNDEIPDIWAMDQVEQQAGYAQMPTNTIFYDPKIRPKDGDLFAIPDGRIAEYVRMDERFLLAKQYGSKLDVLDRHNISASFIKDFEDIIRRQTEMEYDMYHMRYTAFMNKAHQLEHLFRGLDVSVYDILPIAERGLPQAPLDTIKRTNWMDHDSLKYIIDKVERNRGQLNENEVKKTMKEAARSLISRIRGYNIEYQLYQSTQTPEDLCRAIRNDKCVELYNDFAKLDSFGELNFPIPVYRILCNDPEHGAFNMTEFERQILRTFGKGYADFLAYQLQNRNGTPSQLRIYDVAMKRLQNRYLTRG